MILTTIDRLADYYGLHPQLRVLHHYLRTHDLLALPTGRIEIDAERLFINNSLSTLMSPADQKIEVHRRYIDVHIPLDRVERIGWAPLASLGEPLAPFDVENDFALYASQPTTFVDVRPGECLIALPDDGHAPILGEGTLRKGIAKIRIAD